LIDEVVRVDMPTKFGDFKLVAFKEKHNSNEHLALIKGEWQKDEPVMVRVHSSCFTGDILGSLRCDCGEQLHAAYENGGERRQRCDPLYEPGRPRHWLK
jgi:3,4-dihydroxy 2-butanone 4-phosphate synthase/GTP cyclohydrolase II